MTARLHPPVMARTASAPGRRETKRKILKDWKCDNDEEGDEISVYVEDEDGGDDTSADLSCSNDDKDNGGYASTFVRL